ncbi:transposon Tf2-8 polyprotein [Trichonephila clavipes]|nr:transposon Tf2-8 polyprotein [Trichonephila clavipes]
MSSHNSSNIIFVENQPGTALIDSGCQIPVLNSSLIRVNKPSEERITLSSCFNERRKVDVAAINISLTQHSPSLSVRTAISPTLTEKFIIHPSVYTEIKKISHTKSDVLLKESESSFDAYSIFTVANVIENSSYDLSHVKNFNIRNYLSSLIKNYKPNKIKSTKLKMSIILKDDIFLCVREPGVYLILRSYSDLLWDNAVFYFGPEQQLAFQTLRRKLFENPVLHIFKQGAKLELHTDASKFGYGEILLQQLYDSKLRPVHYFSKKTTPQEEKYSSYELEVLAIIEYLKKFRNYLVGNKFKIVTDCSAFQKTMSKKQLTTKIARWSLFLEDFNYEIIHRPGKQMGHVDCLSRYPVMTITYDEITTKLVNCQRNNEYIISLKTLLENKQTTEFVAKNDVLYKIENDNHVLVVPQQMQTEIVKNIHSKGHLGINKTESMSTSSRDALEKLKQQEITFGNPHRIITDKGTAFTSKEFREYCENENIQI